MTLGLLYADHTYEGLVHCAIDELTELRSYAALVHATVRAASAEPASLLLRRALPRQTSGRAEVRRIYSAEAGATVPLHKENSASSSSSAARDDDEAIFGGFDAALERLRPLLVDAGRAAAAACEWSERARRSENDFRDRYRLPPEVCSGLTGTRAADGARGPRLLLWEAELGQRMVSLLGRARAAAVERAKAIARERLASAHRERREQLRKHMA